MPDLRVDLEVIAGLVAPESRVMDLGCGDGLLLDHLIRKKNARGFGVEISLEKVRTCIERGVPVYHGDLDQGLSDHHDNAFDYVILSHTLQTVTRPRFVIQEMLRVGKKSIVSMPNFGHWRNRLSLAIEGRMPQNPQFPFEWHDTPNIHVCTILDFQDLCQSMRVRIIKQIPLGWAGNRPQGVFKRFFSNLLVPMAAANLLAPMAVFLLEKREP
ncbi:MAG: methionine biosynthesis protein MetW [Magnetococcales bacterium]|nr:methionine biosynthesis protein MetW [Magnetococcales bacterium]MBF0154882.1 methionine biosynthesis protein MetW [Magnetococcales bacterium]